MKQILIYILLGVYSYAAFSANIDTLFLKFTSSQQCIVDTGIQLEIFDNKNNFIKSTVVPFNAETNIPLKKGIYDAIINVPNCSPLLLKSIETGKHYFEIKLLCEKIIKDTILIGHPVDYITVWHINPSLVKNRIDSNDSDPLIMSWQNPFCMEKDTTIEEEDKDNKRFNFDINCQLLVTINKPKKLTWNNIKSFFTITKKKESLYLNENYFSVFVYLDVGNSHECLRNINTDEKLYYYRTIFNIFELYARKLRKYLVSHNSFRAYQLREYLVMQTRNYIDRRIMEFKTETKFGQNSEKIKEWYTTIYDELKAYDNYAYYPNEWYIDR